MGVDRKHALKWLSYQGKSPYTPLTVCAEGAVLKLFRFCYRLLSPFRAFLRNGWETNKFPVYTFSENALKATTLAVP